MNATFEMNNVKKDDILFNNKFHKNSQVVKIYSELCQGNDTSKYGKATDKTIDYVKLLSQGAVAGDVKSVSELNTLRKYAVEPLLEADIKMISVFGDFKQLGFDESIEVEAWDIIGEKSREQANNSDIVFAGLKKNKYTVGTQTVSGGWATDYRKMLLGDMTMENIGMQQVRTDILNKMKKIIIENAKNAIKNATGVKNTFEGAGLTKTGVDGVINAIRRLGTGVSVIGDYALLAQFTPWAGYNAEFTYSTSRYGYTQGIAAQDLTDIRAKGILGGYNGAALVEMANPYDFTSKNSDGTNFDTILDAGVGIVTPIGGQFGSPIKSWTRGGLTTFTGNDVTTGHVLSRFDIEFASDVIKGREFQLGVLIDTNL